MAKASAGNRPVSTESRRARTWQWIAIAWVVAYFVWFYGYSFQDSSPALARLDILLGTPELLLSNVFDTQGGSSGSWKNLPQRFDLIAVAAAIWCSAWATGNLLLRALRAESSLTVLERHVFACGLGISALSLITLGFGLVGWLSPWVPGGALVLLVLSEAAYRARRKFGQHGADAKQSLQAAAFDSKNVDQRHAASTSTRRMIYQILAWTAAFLFLLAMLLGSFLPPIDFDVKTYHLNGPKEFFLLGKITFLPHNVYTSFPFLTEMLCLLAMVLRQDWFRGALAGQAVLMGFAPLTSLALYCAARRWFPSGTSWLAALIYLTTPWTYRLAVIAYVEGALSCFLFLSLFALILAMQSRPTEMRLAMKPWRLFLVSGLLAGSAMACKYPALVSVVLPVGMATVWSRFRGRPDVCEQSQFPQNDRVRQILLACLAFIVGVAAAVGPWLTKNFVETGNPVYPLAYRLLDGRDWSDELDQRWRMAHSPAGYAPAHLFENVLDVVVRSNWLSPLLFSLAPLAFFAWRRDTNASAELARPKVNYLVVWLWLYVLYLFATWWLLTHRLDRFWIPLLPIVAWLAAMGASWSTQLWWIVTRNIALGLTILFNLAFVTTSLCGLNSYLSDLEETRVRCEYTAEDVQYLNRLLTEGKLNEDAVVLSVGQAQTFDARMKVIYNTAFDRSIFCDWFAEERRSPEGEIEFTVRPIARIRETLAAQRVTHVLINWETLLANRAAFGACDFISPGRVRKLRDSGLLGDPTQFLQGLRAPENLSDSVRRELDTWGAELKDIEQGRPVYIAWQIFPIEKRETP